VNDPAFGDDMGLPWWFKLALVVMGLFLLFMVVMVIRAVRRTKHTKAYVAARGWTYRSRDRQLAKRWTGPPFESGHDRRCEDIVEGTYEGWPFAAFVYRYDTGTGDDESTWSTAVVALLCETSLPDLDVIREGAFGRAMGKMLNYDLQLESEEFNRAYTVRADDRKFASSVLHPRMMEQLLRGDRESWSIRNGDLLGLDNWNGKPEQITTQLDHLLAILQIVPDVVWQDHGGRPDQLKQGVS
jgi:hypothetical protein